MNVFSIEFAQRKGLSLVDLGERYTLPLVHCEVCGETWGERCVDYPAFKFSFLNKSEFNDDRVVSVSEFERIAERISRSAGRKVLVRPGSAIGELEGEAFAMSLNDFTWGRASCAPQISQHARDLLAQEGINILTADIILRCRGKPLRSHLAVQPEPAILLTEGTLIRHGITHCRACDRFDVKYPRPKIPEDLEIRMSAWPKPKHLVKSVETGHIFASEQFMAAAKKHKLSGLTFVERGHFV